MPVRYTTVPLAPLGPVHVAWTEHGVCCLTATGDERSFQAELSRRFGGDARRDDGRQAGWEEMLNAWLAGEPVDAALDVGWASPFERTILERCRAIPRGEVRPYQWLSAECGGPGAARAAGTVMRKNPIPLLIPCHRVVTAAGDLGNYSMGGPTIKRMLLEAEGVDVDRLEGLARQGYRFKADPLGGSYCYPSCRAGGSGWEELVRTAREAQAKGYRPCPHCRPV